MRSSTRPALVRVSKIHVFIAAAFAAQLIIYDAGKLITPDVVLKRWVSIGLLATVSAIVWFLARTKDEPKLANKLVYGLILTDIIIACFNVYTQRGMASRAVILFVIPIITAAVLKRKGLIYLTAVLSAVSYIVTAVAYFVLNFNEGYKLELYGEILFYSTIILTVAGLTWSVTRTKH